MLAFLTLRCPSQRVMEEAPKRRSSRRRSGYGCPSVLHSGGTVATIDVWRRSTNAFLYAGSGRHVSQVSENATNLCFGWISPGIGSCPCNTYLIEGTRSIQPNTWGDSKAPMAIKWEDDGCPARPFLCVARLFERQQGCRLDGDCAMRCAI